MSNAPSSPAMSTDNSKTAKDPKKWERFVPVQAKHEWTPKDHYITFYIPSRTSKGKSLDFRVRNDLKIATMKFLLDVFGGATLIEGKGYFNDSVDETITHEEEVTLCKSFCELHELQKKDGMIRSIANALAIEGIQDMISVEIDGVMYFYKPRSVYREIYNRRFLTDKSDYHQLLSAAEEASLKTAESDKAEALKKVKADELKEAAEQAAKKASS